jgi:hypothetical protein
MRRAYIIIAGILILLIIVLGALFTKSAKQPKYPPAQEHGSATTTVALNGTQRLSQLLLPDQFGALKKALSSYIRANVSPSVISADIVPGETILNNDGSISFTVKVTKPAKTFNVLLQRPDALEMIFSVPGSGIEPTTLQPFASQQ